MTPYGLTRGAEREVKGGLSETIPPPSQEATNPPVGLCIPPTPTRATHNQPPRHQPDAPTPGSHLGRLHCLLARCTRPPLSTVFVADATLPAPALQQARGSAAGTDLTTRPRLDARCHLQALGLCSFSSPSRPSREPPPTDRRPSTTPTSAFYNPADAAGLLLWTYLPPPAH